MAEKGTGCARPLFMSPEYINSGELLLLLDNLHGRRSDSLVQIVKISGPLLA